MGEAEQKKVLEKRRQQFCFQGLLEKTASQQLSSECRNSLLLIIGSQF